MTTPEKKSGPGCFFYGCLTSILLVILVAVGGYLGVKWWVNHQLIPLTDPQPMELPQVEFTPEEARAARLQVDAFAKAIEAGKPAPPLVLDERALNLLIASVPELEPIRNHIYLSIRSNRIQGAISLPLEKIPVPFLQKFKGRYLNGAAGLNVSLTNGFFSVTLQSLELKGKSVPEQAMAQLRQQNLAKDFYKNQEGMQTLQKLRSITVEDGRLVIKPRASE
jgi:hypothetical protein